MLSGRKLNSVELDVKLTAEEAIRRISSVVDKDKPFSIFRHTGDNPLIGKIKGSSFRIWLKKDYANSWSQILYGTVKPGKAGCRIHGRFGEYWFVRLFTIVLLGMIAFFVLIGSIVVYADLVRRTFDARVLAVILAPLCMLGFGIALRNWGKRIGKAEGEQVRELFLELFDDVQYEN